MADFRRVTQNFSVASQLGPEDMALAAGEGFVLVINNRPDGEAPGQPPGAHIEAAAAEAGLGYLYIPVRGMPSREQAAAVAAACAKSEGPVLAYCRSGTRSITTWALGEALSGARTGAEAQSLAASAGYDLSHIFG